MSPDPAKPVRPRGMPDGVEPELPDGALAVTFECAACGAWAMRLVLRTKGPDQDLGREPVMFRGTAWLEVESGLGRSSHRLRPADAEGAGELDRDLVLAAMEQGSPAAIYAVNFELTPSWCPKCAATYCREHWVTWDVYDEPDAPWWYDSTRGRCPRGHERMLWD